METGLIFDIFAISSGFTTQAAGIIIDLLQGNICAVYIYVR